MLFRNQFPTAEAAIVSTCNRVEILVASDSEKPTNPLEARWTDLRRLDAIGGVHLEEPGRSMFGDTLVFRGDTNTIILKGRPDADAMMYDENEASQHSRQWRGPMITWNRTTGAVDAPNPQITSR